MGRVAERPDDVRMRNREYRFDEAERSASSFSVSLPSGGPLKALPGPEPRRFLRAPAIEEDGLSARHALLPSTTPTAGGSGQQPDPRTGRVSPSTPVPLDHPPPPQWSLALRPFLATRWDKNTGGLSASDWRDQVFYKRLIGLGFVLERTGIERGVSPQVLPLAGEVIAKRSEGEVLLTHCGLPPPASGRLPLQGEDLVACSPPTFAPKGAILRSHGETIAGLSRSLKAGPPGRRGAAGRRPGLD